MDTATALPPAEPHTDSVDGAKLFAPIDHGEQDAIPIPAEVIDGSAAPPAAPGAPLAATVIVIVEIAINHLTPGSPLTSLERDQLRAALDGLEAYYGPLGGGPAVLWGNLAVIVFWIGFPRYLALRAAASKAAADAAAEGVEPGA